MACRPAVETLRSGAAVVLVGSVASSLGIANYGTYAATKAALRSYARTWGGPSSRRAASASMSWRRVPRTPR